MKPLRESRVARVLTEPCLILGVEKPYAIANFTLCMVLVGELHLLAFGLVSLLVHLVLRRATRADPFTRQAYIRYNLQGDEYDPWVRIHLRQGPRPGSALAGVLC